MEVFYKRSMSESYMVIGGTDILEEETYQIRMLLENQVQNLLPCKVQKLNGEKQYYYEISGCQSLQNLYEKRKFGRQELEQLFRSVLCMMERLDEYLMSRDNLMLQPSYIFQNKENDRYFFVWIPVCQGDIEIEFRQLAEYILPKIDHTDKNAVTLGYGIYKESVETHMNMECLKAQIYARKEELVQEEKTVFPPDEAEQERQKILDEFYEEEEEAKVSLSGKIFLASGMVFVAGMIFVMRYFGTSWTSPLVLTFVAGILILAIVGAIGYHLWKKKEEKRVEVPIYQEKSREVLEPVWKREPVKERTEYTVQETGATVLLQEDQGDEAYLEEIGAENPRRYYLKKEVTVIGKWRDQADILLDLPTVSRLHAKIIRKDQETVLVDVNSRNGTMLNDIWIDPEREYLLHKGDILVFAQKKFRYVSD